MGWGFLLVRYMNLSIVVLGIMLALDLTGRYIKGTRFPMLSRQLSLRINPELERRIRQYSRSIGQRPSVVVREVLEQHFAKDRPAVSCYDLARQAGVIGCVVNAPPDLSTRFDYPER